VRSADKTPSTQDCYLGLQQPREIQFLRQMPDRH
jgi:hypothetical protein